MTVTEPPPDAAEWTCDGQADLLDELEATPVNAAQWWANHGRNAALDRLRTGRPIDPAFVAALDADCAGTVRQRGGDVETALLALHAGLYSAHATTIGGVTPRHLRRRAS